VRPVSFGGHISSRGSAGAGLGLRRTARRVGQVVRYTARYRGRALIAIVALLGTTAATIAGPVVAKQAIDQGITPGDFGRVEFWVAVYLAVALAGWLFAAVQSYLTSWVGERVLTDLRSDLFRHIQRLELGYFERTRAGVVISRLTNDIEALNTMVTDGPTTLVQNTITLIGSAAVLLYLDWRLALATLVVFPGMSIATGLYRHFSAIAYRRTRERLGEVTANLQEDISGVRVVQAFRREGSNYRRFLAVNDSYREANQETVTVSAYYFPFVNLLSATAMAVVLGYGGVRVLNGEITAGALFVFIGLLSNFFDPVQQLSQFYQTFLAGTAALDKVFDVLETAPAMVDMPGVVDLPEIDGRVQFEDVTFAYRQDTAEVLHGISFTAEPGQTIALVGHTGAGKSTVVKLLARFYDPTGGRITMDGYDLRDVTMHSLRRQLGIVPQEAFLFAGTVRDNIAFGRPDATDAEVVAAAVAVGADGFIRDLPDGYDTQIEERGARLSIGQRQLVAFARALLANPRLLILDEATSSVDIPTEARIEAALEALLSHRTSFVVAHRLSTIRRADLIVVLEHGRVIEMGSHEQLIALRGRYFSLYDDWVENIA
jgi:ABC-type multidrug transport system fused ATPase/permease subunit